MYGSKQKIVPMIALKRFLYVNPKFVNFFFLKMQTIVIPNPATPNCTPSFSSNLGTTEILLSATKCTSCSPVTAKNRKAPNVTKSIIQRSVSQLFCSFESCDFFINPPQSPMYQVVRIILIFLTLNLSNEEETLKQRKGLLQNEITIARQTKH